MTTATAAGTRYRTVRAYRGRVVHFDYLNDGRTDDVARSTACGRKVAETAHVTSVEADAAAELVTCPSCAGWVKFHAEQGDPVVDTDAVAREFRSEYRVARVEVHRASGIAATYAAETAAQRVLERAERAGVDLLPEALQLDELARGDYFRTLTTVDLRDLLTTPYARGLARTVLTERGEL